MYGRYRFKTCTHIHAYIPGRTHHEQSRRIMNMHRYILTIALLASNQLFASERDELFESFFEQDSDDVNEGELRFIPAITDRRVLTTEVKLDISADSLQTGMVDMQQCYSQLVPAAELDIVYQFPDFEALRVASAGNTGTAVISGQTVQLQDIDDGARLCVSARVKVLEQVTQESYLVRYGPWFRRYLDGCYPYHVILRASYPAESPSMHGLREYC